MFGADLSILSIFFESIWSDLVAGLREGSKTDILSWAGMDLRALGRLTEAIEPTQTALKAYISRGEYEFASKDASNLSELHLTIGDVKQALTYAEQSIQLAGKSEDESLQMLFLTTYADTLHQAGRLAEGKAAYQEAEKLQKILEPKSPFLYSVQGYQYCDLLLSQGNFGEVERRANWMVKRSAEDSHTPLSTIALEYLSLACANLLKSQPTSNLSSIFDRAVGGLRQAGVQDYLPLGLLARAEYYRLTDDLVKAQKDVDEAFTIATRGGMGLHLADCHLEFARLNVARGTGESETRPYMDEARKHLVTAKEMINKMGYHRRDKEVEELEEQLKT